MAGGLGCTIHTAFIYDRGGARRLFQIDLPSSIKWGRLRDDISGATVIIRDPSKGCQESMTKVHPNRHELVIYRGTERVWEGPISRMGWHRDFIEVEARDVMYYAYRTVMRAGYDNSSTNVDTTINRSIDVLGELSRKEALSPPINVLPYITAYTTPNDAQTTRKTVPFQSTVFQDIDSMAHRVGMDYVVIGRSILLFDTHTVWAKTPQVTEADFLGDIIVTYYGLEHATHATVTSGEGLYGTTGANDPFYGEWEILDQAYDESGTVAPTEAALLSQAVRNLDGRNPVPLHVRIPDNSQLNPNGVLQMKHLVPGIRIPLRATLLSLEVSQMQKLDRVTVTEDGERGEAITVIMSPASQNDEEPEE
jgi:hypothetical protein